MNKKLTLNVQNELISFAHEYSVQAGVSVSKLFEHYLIRLKNSVDNCTLNPKTAVFYGAYQNSVIPDKKTLRSLAHEKNSH